MSEAERRLLGALAWMCEQYLRTGPTGPLDHMCMSAGENAVDLLVEYGLMERNGRGGIWTEAGRELLNST